MIWSRYGLQHSNEQTGAHALGQWPGHVSNGPGVVVASVVVGTCWEAVGAGRDTEEYVSF